MNLLEEVKKNSSKWIKSIDPQFEKFYWQNGYGIFSVNPNEKDIVANYIKNQEEHHKTISFKEEYLSFSKQYNIDFDEQYMYD